jgi:signal transduction histidine kinase
VVVHAVVGAAGEALTNVAKHSGATSAVVRATLSSTELRVTVLDHGAGFDASRTPYGAGLAESITKRVQEVGGHVCVESWPGSGTYVELVVPVP